MYVLYSDIIAMQCNKNTYEGGLFFFPFPDPRVGYFQVYIISNIISMLVIAENGNELE